MNIAQPPSEFLRGIVIPSGFCEWKTVLERTLQNIAPTPRMERGFHFAGTKRLTLVHLCHRTRLADLFRRGAKFGEVLLEAPGQSNRGFVVRR